MRNTPMFPALHLAAAQSPFFRHLVTLGILPVLLFQALRVRRRVPILPEAAGARQGNAGSGKLLRLLIAGDSSAAGVGAEAQTEALAGSMVSTLAEDFRVQWRLVAGTGWTTVDVHHRLAALPAKVYDIALTATGVNDVTGQVPVAGCLRRLEHLAGLLRRRFAVRRILVSGLPPVHRFPSLPEPLRWYLGTRARLLDAAIASWCRREDDCMHLPLDFPVGIDTMASDGFHPGPGIYRLWGRAGADAIRNHWR